MTTAIYRVIDSPVGPLTVAGDGHTIRYLRMAEQTHEPDRSGWKPAAAGAFGDAVDQLGAYFAGELTDFNLVLDLAGTDFQRRVWAVLRTIPYGQTRSYGQIAAEIGSPGAARAIGLANGRNPVAIIVPCHRVIGSSGELTGYGGGIARKTRLLELERRFAPDTSTLF